MSDSSAVLASLLDDVRAQAADLVVLDGPRAEAWASDVLALAAESLGPDGGRALASALARHDDPTSAVALEAMRSLDRSLPAPEWTSASPEWVAALGTSRPESAALLRARGAQSAAFTFVDDADARHVVMVDLLPGPPETVGEVHVGPVEVLAARDEEGSTVETAAEGESVLTELGGRVAAALAATSHPSESVLVNGRLLIARLALLVDETPPMPEAVEAELPPLPPRDPEDDEYARSLLERALPDSGVAPSADDLAAARALAAWVAPSELGGFTAAQADAVVTLEWADWIGAVIGFVRSGAGTPVSGAAAVDAVNRCPEVTTTIPKQDRDRIEWAFDTVIASWPALGIVDDDGLTPAGLAILPAALRLAWAAE